MKVFLNRKYIDIEKAKISCFDRGLLYGEGVFETIKSYQGKPFLLDRHYKRLKLGLRALGFKIDLSLKKCKNIIEKLLMMNKLKKEAYIRITVTGGENTLRDGIIKKTSIKPTVFIFVKKYPKLPKEFYKKGVSLTISPFKKNINSILPYYKTTNYLENIAAKREAVSKGFYESIFLNNEGYLSEGTTTNIFLVKKNVIYTPSVKCGILPGITREFVIQLARKFNLKTVISNRIRKSELFEADEVFITNSIIEILPVSKIDNKKIGNGKVGNITKLLMENYREKK